MRELTKDRVERAIAEINPNPPRYGQGIPSPEAAQTALAALDAVRWRSPETMPDYHDVLVAFRRSDGSLGCAITVKLEIPEYVTVLGWRPVLMWEEEG